MSDQPLKIAAIGLTDEAIELLDIAGESKLYTITAVGDKRLERAEKSARTYECPAFTDYRQLIIQTQADFLLFGGPMHQCSEYIAQAMAAHFNILKSCPPALNFEQLSAFYRLANKEQVLFITAQNGRFSLPFEHVRRYLAQAGGGDSNPWHLISAICHVPVKEPEPEMRWLNDPKMAGGGVLLQYCYGLIDELILCFGLPQRIYALTINQAPDRQQRMSLTEDTAIVAMQFTDALIAQICASRTLGPARRHLRVHGKQQHLTATPEEVVIYDNMGNLLEQQTYPDDVRPSKKRMLERLVSCFNDPVRHPLFPAHGFDLNTLAVIEAAYLSARTGMAEEPARIMKLAETGTAGIL